MKLNKLTARQVHLAAEDTGAALEERKAMAMGGVPEPYLDARARLQCQKPVRISDADWRQAIDEDGQRRNSA